MDRHELGEQWQFLWPWCRPLDSLLRVKHEYMARVPILGYWGVVVQLCPTQASAPATWWTSVRDAFLLLTLVAHVDHEAWKLALLRLCDLQVIYADEIIGGEDFPTRFELDVDTGFEPADANERDKTLVTLLGQFAMAANSPPTPTFLESARRIVSLTPVRSAIDIEIPIAIELSNNQFDPDLWRSLAAIKSAYPDCRIPVGFMSEALGVRCTFVLALTGITLDACFLNSDAVTMMKTAITDNGIPLSWVKWNVSTALDQSVLEIGSMGRMLEHFIRTGGEQPIESVVVEVRVDYTRWSDAPDTEVSLARILSALEVAKSIGRLQVWLPLEIMPAESRTRVWEQLGYTLFSKHSQSSVRTVELNDVSIVEADVDAVAAVLQEDDPTRLVFGRSQLSECHHRSGSGVLELFTLRRGATVTLLPMNPNETISAPNVLTLDSDISGVKIVDYGLEHGHAIVLLPGYGTCTIRRDELAVSSRVAIRDIASRDPISLKLSCQNVLVPSTGVRPLLELVGHQLSVLWLQLPNHADGLEAHILRYCPNLTTLILQHDHVDTRLFIAAYEATNSRIAELDCHFDDILLVLEELRDIQTPLGRNIRKFSFDVHFSDDEMLRAFKEMLESNHLLEYLELTVPMDRNKEDWLELERFHNQAMFKIGAPIPRESRLAVLSILLPSIKEQSDKLPPGSIAADTPSRAAFHFDKAILALIFDFAAAPARRRIWLRENYFDGVE